MFGNDFLKLLQTFFGEKKKVRRKTEPPKRP
jgi:hypothetical protein